MRIDHALWFVGSHLSVLGVVLAWRLFSQASRPRSVWVRLLCAAALPIGLGLMIWAWRGPNRAVAFQGFREPIYVVSLGMLTASVWLVVFARGKGRSDGVPRCPKCRYDMSGSSGQGSATCPECGLEIQDPRVLTLRRGWRRGILLALALALFACEMPGIWHAREGGVKAFVPTTVLIAGCWWFPEDWIWEQRPGTAPRWSLQDRIERGHAFAWQSRWLESRIQAEVSNPSSAKNIVRLIESDGGYDHLTNHATGQTYVWCWKQMVSASVQDRQTAILVLAWIRMTTATPAYVAALERVGEVRGELLQTLGSQDAAAFYVALGTLADAGGRGDDVLSAIPQDLPTGYDTHRQLWAIRKLIVAFGESPKVLRIVDSLLNSKAAGDSIAARDAIAEQSSETPLPELIRERFVAYLLRDTRPGWRSAIRGFVKGPNRDERIVRALFARAISHGSPQCQALLAIAELNERPDLAVRAVESGLVSGNDEAALAAISLAVKCRLPRADLWRIRLMITPFLRHAWPVTRDEAERALVVLAREERAQPIGGAWKEPNSSRSR